MSQIQFENQRLLESQRNMKLFATLAVALAATKEDVIAKYQGKDQKFFYTVIKNR